MRYQLMLYESDELVTPLFETDVTNFDDLLGIELRAAIDHNVPIWQIRSIEMHGESSRHEIPQASSAH